MGSMRSVSTWRVELRNELFDGRWDDEPLFFSFRTSLLVLAVEERRGAGGPLQYIQKKR